MKVKELKTILESFSDDVEVILSSDGEGNSYSPLADAEECFYVPDTTWCGEVHIKELTPELIKQGYTEEDVWDEESGIDAVVLYPTN